MPNWNQNPYVGPRTFTRQEGDRFFGREREARDLLARVISERLTLFYAQSGAGKSSLINTRLIPQLRAEQFVVMPIGRVSGELPAGVGDVANIFIFNLLLSLDQGQNEPARFVDMKLNDFATRLATVDGEYFYYDPGRDIRHQPDDQAQSLPHVLIIDQFEEIVTTHLGRWQEREDFFRQLARLMLDDPLLWVVLTLREDYLASLDPYAHLLPGKMQNRFSMQRMGYEAALEAVQKPAEQAGRPFTPAAAQMLVDNLRKIRVQGAIETRPGQFVEPVQLQVVCYQLWENLKEKAVAQITEQELQEAGDIDTALAEFYEQVIQRTLAQLGGSELELRNWFERKLITEAGTRGTAYQGAEDTAGLPNKVVKALADQYLLRAEIRAGGAWYELIHDRFVEPILQANIAWQLRQSPLTRAAQAWDQAGRPKDKLYTGQQLKDALARAKQEAAEPLVEAFLAASVEENRAVEAEARRAAEEKRARAAEAQARQQRQTARRRIIMMSVLTALALVIVAVNYFGSLPATQTINLTSDIRVPTTLSAARAEANLLRMLGALQGYLAQGDSLFRDNYAQARQAFEANLAELQALAPLLDPEARQRIEEFAATFEQWSALPPELFELRDDQLAREPAYRSLTTQALPLSSSILADFQTLVEQQVSRDPSTALDLISDLSTFQDSWHAMQAALSSYVTTRDPVFKQMYETHREDNQVVWDRLKNQEGYGATWPQQAALLEAIGQNRRQYLQLADDMMSVVEGEHWREDYRLFNSEVAPLAQTMQELLSNVTADQQELLQIDLNQGRSSLNRANQQALAAGGITLVLGLGMILIEILGTRRKAGQAVQNNDNISP